MVLFFFLGGSPRAEPIKLNIVLQLVIDLNIKTIRRASSPFTRAIAHIAWLGLFSTGGRWPRSWAAAGRRGWK